MNSAIDKTLGILLTEEEYDLLSHMNNCDQKGFPLTPGTLTLDCVESLEIVLRRWIANSNIDIMYYNNMFGGYGWNKVDVIKLVNRVMLKYFTDVPLVISIINTDRKYEFINGANTFFTPVIGFRSESFGESIIHGNIVYNDRIINLCDIKWGGITIKNIDYDDILVIDLSLDKRDSKGVTLYNRVNDWRSDKRHKGIEFSITPRPGIQIDAYQDMENERVTTDEIDILEDRWDGLPVNNVEGREVMPVMVGLEEDDLMF